MAKQQSSAHSMENESTSQMKEYTRSEQNSQIDIEIGHTTLQQDNTLNLVKYLLDEGNNINTKDENGRSLIISAAKRNHENVVCFLTKRGAELNLKDNDQNTALFYGVNNDRIVRNLIQHGAEIRGSIVRQLADEQKWNKVWYLIESGASITDLTPECKSELLKEMTAGANTEHKKVGILLATGNVELFDMFTERIEVNFGSEKLYKILIEAYEEVKLKNVDLSQEIEFCVQDKLIDLQFFKTRKQVLTVEEIQNRITITVDLITELKYCDVNSEWVFIAKCVSQNIDFMKRHLKSTYSTVPWEEIEFCLVTFVSVLLEPNKTDIVYKLILNKEQLLNHLETFKLCLTKLKCDITQKDVNSKLPKLGSSQLSFRENLINSVLRQNPGFKEIYDDYDIIRDVYSLKRIIRYASVAISVDPSDGDIGKFVIERCIQVIGESLKNSPESPNISLKVQDRFVCSAQGHFRRIFIMKALRDKLSHAESFYKRRSQEEYQNDHFFYRIQVDISKIKAKASTVLCLLRTDTMKIYQERVALKKVKTQSLTEWFDVEFPCTGVLMTEEYSKIQNWIMELYNKLPNQTEDEKKYFQQIFHIISDNKTKVREIQRRYFRECFMLLFPANIFKVNFSEACKQQLDEGFSDILTLIANIFDSFNTRTETIGEIHTKIFDIVTTLASEGTIKGIDQLEKTMNVKKIPMTIGTKLKNETLKAKFYSKLDQMIEIHDIKQKVVESIGKKYSSKEEIMQMMKTIKMDPNQERKFENFYDQYDKTKMVETLNRYDNYGTFISRVRKDNGNSIKAVTHLFKLFKLGKGEMEELDDVIDTYYQKGSKQLVHILNERMKILKKIFPADVNNVELWLKYKSNEKHQLATEIILLDILEILEQLSCIQDNVYFLDDYNPVIIGKNLRNYLAHGSALLDTFSRDFTATIVSNALRLSSDVIITNLRKKKIVTSRVDAKEDELWLQKVNSYKNLLSQQEDDLKSIAEGKRNIENIDYVDRKQRDMNGRSLLHLAVQNDCLKLVKYLLEKNFSPYTEDSRGKNAFHVAAFYGKKYTLDHLIATEQYNVVNNKRKEILHYAIMGGSKETVEYLIELGCLTEDMNDSGLSPLHIAAQTGHTHILELLLKRGYNTEVKTPLLVTPMALAIMSNNEEAVKVLHQYGASVNPPSFISPLDLASYLGNINIVEHLLHCGASVNHVNAFNAFPLCYAIESGNIDVVRTLLEHGANIHMKGMVDFSSKLLSPFDKVRLLNIRNYEIPEVIELDRYRNGCEKDHAMNDQSISTCFETTKSLVLENLIYEMERCLKTNKRFVFCRVADLSKDLEKSVHTSSLESENKYEDSLLQRAAAQGQNEMIKLLLEYGANIDSLLHSKYTALNVACLFGQTNTVNFLLENGASTGDGYNDEFSPLYIASEKGYTDIVDLLLEKGAMMNSKACENGMPILGAIKNGHIDIVKTLVDKCSSKGREHQLCHALYVAAEKGYLEVVELLIKNGASVNSFEELTEYRYSALHAASKEGHVEVVKILLKHGANIEAVNKDNKTCLCIAAQNGHRRVVELLLQFGAQLNKSDSNSDTTALHCAIENGQQDIMDYLLDKNADVNSINKKSYTPLYIAARGGYKEMVEKLILKKADPNIGNSLCNPLAVAIIHEYEDIVSLLIDEGIEIDIPDIFEGQEENPGKELQKSETQRDERRHDNITCSPLMIAAKLGREQMVDILLERGVSINGSEKSSLTTLQIATLIENKPMLKILLKKGADLAAVRYTLNLTPIEIAASSGQKEICDILIKNGASVNRISTSWTTPLHCASWSGNVDLVHFLLEKGAVVNAIDEHKLTPLHLSSFFGHEELSRILIISGGLVNGPVESEVTPLQMAVYRNMRNIVKVLLENGADLSCSGNVGLTPLHIAVHCEHEEMVNELITRGAITCSTGNGSPLRTAVHKTNIPIIKYLLRARADIEQSQALHVAVVNEQTDIIELLIREGADINSLDENNHTPLHYAILSGNEIIVRILTEHNCDVNGNPKCEWSPLHLTAMYHRYDILRILLEKNPIVDPVSKLGTPLHIAVGHGFTDIVEALLLKGARVEGVSSDHTELHFAVVRKHKEVAEVLLRYGANVNPKDKSGLIPLQYAVRMKHFEMSSLLIQQGADLTARDQHATILHYATYDHTILSLVLSELKVKYGEDEIVQFVNEKDSDGDTPLMWTAEKGRCDGVKMLIEYGADVNIKNNKGTTSLHWAAKGGFVRMIEVLLERNADANVKDEFDQTPYDVIMKKVDNGEEGEDNEMIAVLLLSSMNFH